MKCDIYHASYIVYDLSTRTAFPLAQGNHIRRFHCENKCK